MSETELTLKSVDRIEGKFCIPIYQRGYRWGTEEVTRLLDDIYNLLDHESSTSNVMKNAKNYCLQPIVLKKLRENFFEVIDGQQRLTTIFIIYKFMQSEPNFTLTYDTRKKSEEFLENISQKLYQDRENIDFWFMSNAYKTVEAWFREKISSTATNMRTLRRNFENLFTYNVQIIWYEVDADEDGTALFTRLNVGKIPLTNAELVKAMFLSRSNENINYQRQEEIALQWDNIEKELHDDSLWYFLTNGGEKKYQTRIDLLLDVMADKKNFDREVYSTFFRFDMLRKSFDMEELWQEVVHTFWQLKDWYENHELYHKIGYLIAADHPEINLTVIYKESIGRTKREFLSRLDELIKKSISLGEGENYIDWDYFKNSAELRRLILLFNIESVRQNGETAEWFPFDKFKFEDKKKISWSLGNIHSMKSQRASLSTYREWLQLHKKSLENFSEENQNLISEIDALLAKKNFSYSAFENLQEKIVEKLSLPGEETEYLDSVANLTLLKCEENSALGNSAFDVKRTEIISMEQRGEFIPFCTKMTFHKYYTKAKNSQPHFWTQADRFAYINSMNEVLKNYLQEPIDSVRREE